ncbi:MAG: YciI family protein [Vitreoscilla sp.]|nr:YciI family protein [Vitreoscilla sp.]
MRFMILVKAGTESGVGGLPDERLLSAMAAYQQDLARAGVLLDAACLKPCADGWRVRHEGGASRVLAGPFMGTGEFVAGYTLIQVRSRDEALEWSRRFPAPQASGTPCSMEVRPLFEAEPFAHATR